MKYSLRILPPCTELPALVAALRIHPVVTDRRRGAHWTVQCSPQPGKDAAVFDLLLTLHPVRAATAAPEPATVLMMEESGAPCAVGTPDARGVLWFRSLPAVPLRATWQPQATSVVSGPSHKKLAALPAPPVAVDTGHRQFTAELVPGSEGCVLEITSRALPTARIRFRAGSQTIEDVLENGALRCALTCRAEDCDAGLEEFTVLAECS